MADISKINVDNFEYNVKDIPARADIADIKINLNDINANIEAMQSTLENSIDNIYDAIVSKGVTPVGKSLEDIINAIGALYSQADLDAAKPTSATLDNAGNLIVKNAAGEDVYTQTFTNNYNKGKADGDVKHQVYASAYGDVRSGISAYIYIDGQLKQKANAGSDGWASAKTSTFTV